MPLATMTVVLRGRFARPIRAERRAWPRSPPAIADKGTATRSADQIAADFEKLGASFSSRRDPTEPICP